MHFKKILQNVAPTGTYGTFKLSNAPYGQTLLGAAAAWVYGDRKFNVDAKNVAEVMSLVSWEAFYIDLSYAYALCLQASPAI